MAATLDGHLGDLRQDRRAIRPGDGGRRRGGDVADDEHVGMTRHREVGTDDDTSALGEFDAEQLGQRVGPHAGRPHDDPGG